MAACFFSNSTLGLADDGRAGFDGEKHLEARFSTPKWESCTTGLAALHGGDPKKNGGDDGKAAHCSALWSWKKKSMSNGIKFKKKNLRVGLCRLHDIVCKQKSHNHRHNNI